MRTNEVVICVYWTLTFTLEALFEESKQDSTTEVTEYAGSAVCVDCEDVGADGVVVLLLGLDCVYVCVYCD